MSVFINENCIDCDSCINACPVSAIYFNSIKTIVNEEICTECVDMYDLPVCSSVCNVEAIIWGTDNVNPSHEKRITGFLVI